MKVKISTKILSDIVNVQLYKICSHGGSLHLAASCIVTSETVRNQSNQLDNSNLGHDAPCCAAHIIRLF